MRHLTLFTILVLTLTACTSDVTTTTTSGIEGQVLIGPMCPVVQDDTPCPDKPYQATITVLDAGGKRVTQFQSDEQGRFKVGLRPGTYTLAPESPDGFTRAGEQSVTVSEGLFTQVAINYDSGIR